MLGVAQTMTYSALCVNLQTFGVGDLAPWISDSSPPGMRKTILVDGLDCSIRFGAYDYTENDATCG